MVARSRKPLAVHPPATAGPIRAGAARPQPQAASVRQPADAGLLRLPGMKADAELLYGRHAILEALRAGRRRMYRVHLGQDLEAAEIVSDIVAAARRLGCPVQEAPRALLDRVAPVNHQGVVAEAGPYPYIDLDDLLARAVDPDALYLALDHLQDVQNLATLLRTAEAMAITGVVLPERRAAGITPAVVNASAGAVEHLPIALVNNLVQALTQLKAANVWVVGLDAVPGAVPLAQADLAGRLALVVGAEGTGLARLVRERCDWLLAIPMFGNVASLNAAVAGSVAVVAARQARSSP